MKLFRSNLIRLTRPPLPPQVKDDPIHVRIRDVHKTYGDHHVLNGVSLDIYRGKTNLIIGPSGSGKTVLMRQLIRLEKPDSGALLGNGVDLAKLEGLNLAAMRRTFGMVFQMSALFDSMRVFDNVAVTLREYAIGTRGLRTAQGRSWPGAFTCSGLFHVSYPSLLSH